MAILYVDDAATDNSGDGLTVGNAKKTVWDTTPTGTTAASAASAGDTIHVLSTSGNIHTETFPSADQTMTTGGTAYSPVHIIPLVALTDLTVMSAVGDEASFDSTSSFRMNWVDTVHVERSKFTAQSIRKSGDQHRQLFVDCLFHLQTTCRIPVASSGGSIFFVNCTFNATSASLNFQPDDIAHVYFIGGKLDSAGSVPNNWINTSTAGAATRYRFLGFDLSHLSTNILGSAGFDDGANSIQLFGCKLHASVTISNNSFGGGGSNSILAVACDDNSPTVRYEYYDTMGDITADTAIHRGTSQEGTNDFSLKMATNANPDEGLHGLAIADFGPAVLTRWLDSTSSKTFTVYLMIDSATTLNDDDVWVEFFLPATTAADQYDNVTSRNEYQTAVTELTTDSGGAAAWTGEGGSPKFYKVETTHTSAVEGLVMAKVHLAKPSTTIFVDPDLEIT